MKEEHAASVVKVDQTLLSNYSVRVDNVKVPVAQLYIICLACDENLGHVS